MSDTESSESSSGEYLRPQGVYEGDHEVISQDGIPENRPHGRHLTSHVKNASNESEKPNAPSTRWSWLTSLLRRSN